MKALSIKQPWASLIALGIKNIENRTRKTNFRGRVFIHASAKNFPSFDFTEEQSKAIAHIPDSQQFPNSAIIGEVDIIGCEINHHSIWAEHTRGWPSDPKHIYNWVLSNAVLYDKPILNVKGKLSFWVFECKHPNIKREDGCDECLECGTKNY